MRFLKRDSGPGELHPSSVSMLVCYSSEDCIWQWDLPWLLFSSDVKRDLHSYAWLSTVMSLCSKDEQFAKARGWERYGGKVVGHPLAGGDRKAAQVICCPLGAWSISWSNHEKSFSSGEQCVRQQEMGVGLEKVWMGLETRVRWALSQRQPRGEGKALKKTEGWLKSCGKGVVCKSGICFTLQQSPLLEKSPSKDSWSGEIEMGMKAQAE